MLLDYVSRDVTLRPHVPSLLAHCSPNQLENRIWTQWTRREGTWGLSVASRDT